MGLGMIQVWIELDDGKRIRYGSEDPVSGNVVLRYAPDLKGRSPGELFGPLQVDVTLKGTFRGVNEKGLSESHFAEDRDICTQTETIFDGTYRSEPGGERRFPFTVFFPENARPKTKTAVSAHQDSNGDWQWRREITDVVVDNLPPTIDSQEQHSMVGTAFHIHYSIVAAARLPGIDITFMNARAERSVHYELPRVPKDAAIMLTEQRNTFDHSLSVRSKDLLPEDSRPSDFISKTKALLKPTNLPNYAFLVTCSGVPTHLFVGQSISFTVRVAPDHERTTSTVVPEVSLSKCTISLIARTTGVAPASLPSSTPTQEVVNMETIRAKDADIIPSGSFHKSHDYTKEIDVGVLSHLPSTFRLEEIRRDYKIRIHMEFTVAGEVLYLPRQFEVVVHPPILTDEPVASGSGSATAAYDAPPPLEEPYDEALPSYGEVIAAGPSGIPAWN